MTICEIGKVAGYRHGTLNKRAARLPGIVCCTWTTVACSKLHSEVNIYSAFARTGWTAAWAAEHWQATQQAIRSAFSSTPDPDHRSRRPTCLGVTNFYSLCGCWMAECQESRTQCAGAHFAMNLLTSLHCRLLQQLTASDKQHCRSKTAHRHASSRTYVNFEAQAKIAQFLICSARTVPACMCPAHHNMSHSL